MAKIQALLERSMKCGTFFFLLRTALKSDLHRKRHMPILIFMAALTFYLLTLAPTVVWGDSAKLAIFSYVINVSLRPEAHFLHSVFGALFNFLPAGNIAFRQNLMSAFFSAASLSMLFHLVCFITHSLFAALSSCLALFVSHIFWLLSVINETYSLNAFFLLAIISLLSLWGKYRGDHFVFLAGFLLALSIGNSWLLPLFVPAFFVFVITCAANFFSLKKFLLLSLFFILGLVPILILAIPAYFNGLSLDRIFGFSHQVSGFFVHSEKIPEELLRYPAYLFYQFPIFGFFLGLIGMARASKHGVKVFMMLFLIFLIDILFASSYMRQRQFNLLMISFLVYAVWIGTGAHTLQEWLQLKFSASSSEKASVWALLLLTITPMALYANIKRICAFLDLDLVHARSLPFRDNTSFFLQPWKKNEYGAQQFAEEVFKIAEPNSLIFADFTPGKVLEYYQLVENRRNDLIIDGSPDHPFSTVDVDKVKEQIRERNIYLLERDELQLDYNIKKLEKDFSIVREGAIFQIKAK